MNVFASPLPLLRSHLVLFAAFVAAFGIALAPAPAPAQPGMPTGANYTDDMPSVARVQSTIQGADPVDTAARQVTIFDYLVSYINRIHTNRDVRAPFTTGEGTLIGQYNGASAQIRQDIFKSHAGEVQRFNDLQDKYLFDRDFMSGWQKQLIGAQASAAITDANAGLSASAKRMHDKEMADLQQAQEAQKQAAQQQTAMVNGQPRSMSNDPMSVGIRRCLELGGSTGSCMGGGIINGILGTVTGGEGMESLTGPGPAGVVLSGNYNGAQGSASVYFNGSNTGSIASCGKLVPEPSKYTITKSAGSLKVTLPVSPTPVTLTMRPDGSFIGPGLITLNGRIITGYQIETVTRDPRSNCAPNCVTSTRTPIYAPATDRCTVGALSAPPPPPPPSDNASKPPIMNGPVGAVIDTLTGAMAATMPDGSTIDSLPGLRMTGKYSSSGLSLDFAGDAVTLDCGQAHAKSPYTVENANTALIVHVQNPGGPFDLIVSADKTLRGSGSTTVNGRLVSGMNGTDITFTPRSERCQISSYSPQQGAPSTTNVAANASPAPASAPPSAATGMPANTAATSNPAPGVTLAITSSFPIAKNPLAGMAVKLMTARFDTMLREAGAPVPDGTTPGQAMAAYVNACPPPTGCPAAAQKMKSYFVGTATFDANGAATISAPVPPGNYYVICSAKGTTGGLVWDLPITLKAGEPNSILLTATNAELVK